MLSTTGLFSNYHCPYENTGCTRYKCLYKHIKKLSRNTNNQSSSISETVDCSEFSKQMLLNHEQNNSLKEKLTEFVTNNEPNCKRIAHSPKTSFNIVLQNPKRKYIVPIKIRQHFLDKLVMSTSKQEAILKEKTIADSSSNIISYKSLMTKQLSILNNSLKEVESSKNIVIDAQLFYRLVFDSFIISYDKLIRESPFLSICPKLKKKYIKFEFKETCIRCGKSFTMTEEPIENICQYHPLKLHSIQGESCSVYKCCKSEPSSPGCKYHYFHVCIKPYDDSNFKKTSKISPNPTIFSIDCEMCYTTVDLELTRVTIVDVHLNKVFDQYVLPENKIIDFNTRFSGISEDILKNNNPLTFEFVRNKILDLIHQNDIVIGHGIENDLKALKIIHNLLVDTKLVFPHERGSKYLKSLDSLSVEFFNQTIHDEIHDSFVDACTCMKLIHMKLNKLSN